MHTYKPKISVFVCVCVVIKLFDGKRAHMRLDLYHMYTIHVFLPFSTTFSLRFIFLPCFFVVFVGRSTTILSFFYCITSLLIQMFHSMISTERHLCVEKCAFVVYLHERYSQTDRVETTYDIFVVVVENIKRVRVRKKNEFVLYRARYI